ncbi:MAG: PKD domain-containing protein [Thermoplasmata archaeon]|nr:PKD domain-containing protein [Thermoplasmata archaeon]
MRSVAPRRFPARPNLGLVLALAVVLGLPAISFVPSPPAASRAAGLAPPPSSTGVVIAPAFVPGPHDLDLGALPAAVPVEVAVGLAGPKSSDAASTLALLDAPGSPLYHHYLSAAEVADRFGPTPTEYASAVRQFKNDGLDVQTSPDRSMLLVQGPSTLVARAFGTTFEVYRDGSRTFFSHPSPAVLPSGLPWTGALGLGNVTPIVPAVSGPAPLATPSTGCTGSGGSGLTPCQVERGYNFSGLIAGGANGTGFTVAVVDDYDGSEPQGQLQADLRSFDTATGTAAGTVDYLYPVPTSANLNDTSTGWGFEEALDIEWARATAPAATLKMTFAPDATAGLYGSVDWLVAHQAANVISLSWGENDVGTYNSYASACPSACNATTDGSYDLLHPVMEAAALEGITVLSASGDCGAAAGTSGDSTDYPASDPYVVGVGGTVLTLGTGDAWSSEVAWSGNASGARSPGCQNQGGSTGGYSPFPRPYWQTGTGISGNETQRGEPDVAAEAGGSGVLTYYGGGATAALGTSVACPIWAGLLTDADSYAGAPLGFVDPTLYSIAAGTSGGKAFHDITSGSNGYAATRGWDPVTGLGSPNGGILVPLLARTTVAPSTLQLTLDASPRFGAAPLTVHFNATATGGTAPYAFYNVDFGDSTSGSAPRGLVNHTYPIDGTYSAWASVFDAGANSTVSEPVEIVVGGSALAVALNSSRTSPTIGQAVTFDANVTGGLAPYTYNWSFGDGTYLHNGTSANTTHAYAVAGGYCATVAVDDSADPHDGGGSNRVLELVGGATTGFCPNATAIVAALNLTPSARDLPGDFALDPMISGGTPPYAVQYTSDDPYVGLCDCAIFRTVGVHRLTAFVNDSVNEEAVVSTNVTLYPALRGTFSADVTSGAAPLLVQFHSGVSGGHGPNSTLWTFGDTASATGSTVNHTYDAPGEYLAIGDASDGYQGNASEAFLIDVTNGTATSPVVTATVSPAVHVPAGTLVSFSASVTGEGGPYSVNWTFSAGLSGYGTLLSEAFPYVPCLSDGSCPLSVGLTVENSSGAPVESLPLALPDAEAGNATGLTLRASLAPLDGDAPFTVFGTASGTGLPGVGLRWAFGDGGSAVGSPIRHGYEANGEYTATLTAVDGGGDVLVRTFAVDGSGPGPQTVVVLGGSNASAGIAPFHVVFNVSVAGGSGPPYNVSWNFGDGTPSGYNSTMAHTYLHPGPYLANVTARDTNGNVATASYPISVYNGTDTDLTLAIAPNVTRPGAPVTLQVAAVPNCTPTSAPGCSPANVTLEATFAVAGGPPTPVSIGGRSTFPVALDAAGYGTVPLDAPADSGTYAVTVATTTRNYTGLAVEFLVVNATAAPPPPDRSLDLLLGSTAVGVVAAVVAPFAFRPRRSAPPGAPAGAEPPHNP